MTKDETLGFTESAILQVEALGFLFDWLASEEFESPCDYEQLSRVKELSRFFDPSDRELGRLRGRVLGWLQDKGYVRVEAKKLPGRRREKEYSYSEQKRAEAALWSGWSGCLEEETVRRYRTVLGEHRPREHRLLVVAESLYGLFEENYGLPNGCTATEFGRSHGLPPKLVKAWVRNLLSEEKVRLAYVRGKQVIKTLCRK